jgi:hypothetical protein
VKRAAATVRQITATELLIVGQRDRPMMIATGLGILVVICLLLSMIQTPPEIGR